MQESIKHDLQLSDTQLGLLSGFAFAAFYATFGVIIARWADIGVRRSIIAMAIGCWSLMTALSGMAQSYFLLFLARIGVGVGEAGGNAPSLSLIADIFPPRERATAISVYSLGLNAGVLLGFLCGGWANQLFGWRLTFLGFGVLGLIMAPIMALTVREPRRGRTEPQSGEVEAAPPAVSELLKVMLGNRMYFHMLVGVCLHSMSSAAVSNWTPSYLIRNFGMGSGEVGTWYALIMGIGGGVAVMAGGMLLDRVRHRGLHWYPLVPALSVLICLPLTIAAFLADSGRLTLLFIALPASLSLIWIGPFHSLTQNSLPNRMRALASAVTLLLMNFIGSGLGPVTVGVLSDLMAPWLGSQSLRYAILGTSCTGMMWALTHYLLAARSVALAKAISNNPSSGPG